MKKEVIHVFLDSLKRIVALGTAAVCLSGTPGGGAVAEGQGLVDLLNQSGFEIIIPKEEEEKEEIKETVLSKEEWENGFVDTYREIVKFNYLGKFTNYEAPTLLAALYFYGNYNFTPQDLIPILAEIGYINSDNCIDLHELKNGTTQPVEPEGFINWVNAIACYNILNPAIELQMHEDWKELRKLGQTHLGVNNYPDLSVFVQDPHDRKIFKDWYTSFIKGYDLTEGTYVSNDEIKKVYTAIGRTDERINAPSLNDVSTSVSFLARAIIANQLYVFIENYMVENYLDELLNEVRFYDTSLLSGDNKTFKRLDDVELDEKTKDYLKQKCVSELYELINTHEALDRIIKEDLPDSLQHMLDQKTYSYEDYQKYLEEQKKSEIMYNLLYGNLPEYVGEEKPKTL